MYTPRPHPLGDLDVETSTEATCHRPVASFRVPFLLPDRGRVQSKLDLQVLVGQVHALAASLLPVSEAVVRHDAALRPLLASLHPVLEESSKKRPVSAGKRTSTHQTKLLWRRP